MIYQGRSINPISLWGEYVDLPRNLGHPLPTFLPKVQCPNPDHSTTKHHFQINTRKPVVHCFAHCGISGTYEHALAVVLGIYAKRGITHSDIELAKSPRRPKEAAATSEARAKVGAAHKEARKYILKQSKVAHKGEVSEYAGLGIRKSVTADDAVSKDERALAGGAYTYLPSEAREFLDKRGVDGPSRGKWQIGWDEEAERLVIPALDDRGNFRFLIRQRIDGIRSAKYLYTDGSIKTSLLFGGCHLDRESLQSLGLVLCEGPLDAIRLHQLGIASAVAILGSGLSIKQSRLIDKLGPKRIYLFFDRDSAGIQNIESAKHRIRKVPLYVCRYSNGKGDPAEMTGKEVERSIGRALPISQFYRRARVRALVNS